LEGTYGYITGYAALDIPPRWRHVTDKAAVRSSGYRFEQIFSIRT